MSFHIKLFSITLSLPTRWPPQKKPPLYCFLFSIFSISKSFFIKWCWNFLSHTARGWGGVKWVGSWATQTQTWNTQWALALIMKWMNFHQVLSSKLCYALLCCYKWNNFLFPYHSFTGFTIFLFSLLICTNTLELGKQRAKDERSNWNFPSLRPLTRPNSSFVYCS